MITSLKGKHSLKHTAHRRRHDSTCGVEWRRAASCGVERRRVHRAASCVVQRRAASNGNMRQRATSCDIVRHRAARPRTICRTLPYFAVLCRKLRNERIMMLSLKRMHCRQHKAIMRRRAASSGFERRRAASSGIVRHLAATCGSTMHQPPNCDV